jgi:hypothetical protein
VVDVVEAEQAVLFISELFKLKCGDTLPAASFRFILPLQWQQLSGGRLCSSIAMGRVLSKWWTSS